MIIINKTVLENSNFLFTSRPVAFTYLSAKMWEIQSSGLTFLNNIFGFAKKNIIMFSVAINWVTLLKQRIQI